MPRDVFRKMERIEAVFDDGESRRLDVYVSEASGLSRSHAAKLIEQGLVRVDGNVAGKNLKLKPSQTVCITLPDPQPPHTLPQEIPLDIIYEDSELLVVNKPKGMVVHPAAGNYEGTLVNALLHHCGDSLSGINGVIRPGIVHRIDKNTSGLLIVAKTDRAHTFLAEQIKEHSFTREYEAIVYGNLKADKGTVDAPIGRHPTQRKKMAVTDKNSKNAVSHYTVLERLNGFTHIKVRLETGRTHQIRVHMSHIGHPVAGDEVYGPKKVINALDGQCLHARKIGFVHPDGQYMEFSSELPEYFTEFLRKCR